MDSLTLRQKHDEIMNFVGRHGRYQFIVALLVVLSLMYIPLVPLTLQMMQQPPQFQYVNGTLIQPINNTTTFCQETFYSESFETLNEKIIITDPITNWASDLKIVCHNKKIFSLVGTVYFIASLASVFALAKFPDRYGRRNMYIYLNFFSLIAVIQLFFLRHIAQLLVASFVLGLTSFNTATSSVIVNENLDAMNAGLVMGIGLGSIPFGGIVSTWCMYMFNDWRYYLGLIMIVLLIVNYIGFVYFKESPKWLMANSKDELYYSTIFQIAEINAASAVTLDTMHKKYPKLRKLNGRGSRNRYDQEEVRKKVYEVIDLLKYQSLRFKTLGLLYIWIVSGFSFYALILKTEGLTGDIYIDNTVIYSAQLFSAIGSGYIADKYGRKSTILWSFALTTLCTLIFPLTSFIYLSIPFLFLASIGITSSLSVIFIYSAELYPTNVKSIATTAFFVFSLLSATTLTCVLTVNHYDIFIICALSAVAILVMCRLPESLGYDPGEEIIEEQDTIYEKEKDNGEVSRNDNESDFILFDDMFTLNNS